MKQGIDYRGPESSPAQSSSPDLRVTVRSAGRMWKVQILLSLLLLVVGFVLVVMCAFIPNPGRVGTISGGMVAVAIVWQIVARIGLWLT